MTDLQIRGVTWGDLIMGDSLCSPKHHDSKFHNESKNQEGSLDDSKIGVSLCSPNACSWTDPIHPSMALVSSTAKIATGGINEVIR